MGEILAIALVTVVLSPLLFILPVSWRRLTVLVFLLGLLYGAYILLTQVELLEISFFPSILQAKDGPALLSFSMHPYSKIAAFGFAFVGALGLLYGLQVSRAGEQVMSLAAIASAIGVAFANNFITFLFFWELLTITTSLLIFLKGTKGAGHAAYRVLFLQLIGGFSLTVGIIANYYATGSFAIQVPEAGLPFFILGIGLKTAFLPLHFWVPWGYPAASFPSSVLLAALCTKVGVYGVARILPAGDGITLMGAFMAIIAVSFAIMQSDLRRLLSFHIISQVGYMVAGVGLGFSISVDGGLLHLVNHMIYKALLFMSAGAVIFCAGTENVHDLHHPKPGNEGPQFWKIMPIVTAGAVVGALAISGTPLFNGYVSKYLLKKAAHGVNPVEWMLLIAGVGTALSFAKFVYFGFINARAKIFRKPTVTMHIAIAAAAASCIILGVWPRSIAPLIPYSSSLQVYSLEGVLTATGIVGLGIAIFIVIARFLEKMKFPAWLNADYLVYTPVARGSIRLFTRAGNLVDTALDRAMVNSPGRLGVISYGLAVFEENILLRFARWINNSLVWMREMIYHLWITGINVTLGNLRRFLEKGFRTLLKMDYLPRDLDVTIIIIVLTLILILGMAFLLR